MVLNYSQKKLISLEDELEMLQLYLDMEKLRFKNTFDYNIIYYNDIDAGAIFIPPLIFQPFAENAIWHGIMHNESPGRLDIALSSEKNILNCTITDNGIGRKKASELKGKTEEKQKSMGIQITKQRLALLNHDLNDDKFYAVDDLVDENGNALGTRVTLKIRYKELGEEAE
jgi:sensor histidine kinase YesM